MLQHLIPKVVHQFADALVARALVAWEARAALAIDEAHDDALRQGEGVPIGAEITHWLAASFKLSQTGFEEDFDSTATLNLLTPCPCSM